MNEEWNKLNFSDEIIVKIFSNIDYPGNDNDCWKWIGYFNNKGYGNIGLFGTYHLAHRLIYQCYHGKINPNICVLHHCDNTVCVNPNHLFLGTQQDNLNDMVNKNRSGKGSKNSQSILTEENVIDILLGVQNGIYTSVTQICSKFQISEGPIRDIFKKRNWTHITKNYNMTQLHLKLNSGNLGKGKLSINDVQLIKQRLQNNDTITSIAIDFEVVNSIISNIKKNNIWKHVTI